MITTRQIRTRGTLNRRITLLRIWRSQRRDMTKPNVPKTLQRDLLFIMPIRTCHNKGKKMHHIIRMHTPYRNPNLSQRRNLNLPKSHRGRNLHQSSKFLQCLNCRQNTTKRMTRLQRLNGPNRKGSPFSTKPTKYLLFTTTKTKTIHQKLPRERRWLHEATTLLLDPHHLHRRCLSLRLLLPTQVPLLPNHLEGDAHRSPSTRNLLLG